MTQQEVLDLVYLTLGDVDTTLLPESIVNHYIDEWELIYPLTSASCQLTYKVIISSVNYIIAKHTNDGQLAGAEFSEKEGNVSVEEKYKEKGLVDGWSDWLDAFLRNPVDFLPCLYEVEGLGGVAVPIVTGLDRTKYDEVLSNQNNISNGYRIGSIWGNSDNRRLDSFIRGDSGFGGRRRR